MKKPIILISLCFLLISCTAERKARNRNLIKMNTSINKTFDNNDLLKHVRTLTGQFDMNQHKDNEVAVCFDDQGALKISYKDDAGILRYRCFKGKLKKRYFEFFFEKYRKDIPLIIGHTQIDRIRVKMTKDSVLVVQRYINRTGHIFLMAAGSSHTIESQFQPIKNK